MKTTRRARADAPVALADAPTDPDPDDDIDIDTGTPSDIEPAPPELSLPRHALFGGATWTVTSVVYLHDHGDGFGMPGALVGFTVDNSGAERPLDIDGLVSLVDHDGFHFPFRATEPVIPPGEARDYTAKFYLEPLARPADVARAALHVGERDSHPADIARIPFSAG